MAKFIAGTSRDRLMEAFCDVIGVSHNHVSRIVVDLQVGSVAKVYFTTFADDTVLDVIAEGGEIKVVETEAEALAA